MILWGRSLVACAVAAWALTGCGGLESEVTDAGGANSGSLTSSGSTSPASGSLGSPGTSGVLSSGFSSGVLSSGNAPIGGAGSTPGSGVMTGTAGSLFGSGSTSSGTTLPSSGVACEPCTSGSSSSGTLVTLPPPPPGDVDAQAFCKVPNLNVESLPFVVDTAFVPSGWMGDAPAYAATPADPVTGTPAFPATTARMTLFPTGYSMIGDACTPDGIGRSSPSARGSCWKVTFVPFPKSIQPGAGPGTMKIGGGPGYGWAGALWQYPKNNWGSLAGGYPIPPGATTVSFWARGHDGGERVRFFTGEGLNAPCSDYVSTTSMDATFPSTPAWVHYTIDIRGLAYGTTGITPGQGLGGYFGGVLGAFGFGVGDQTLPPLTGASAPPNETDPTSAPVADPAVPGRLFPPFFESTIQFYIDDIEFQ
jgi:hypothetical protein